MNREPTAILPEPYGRCEHFRLDGETETNNPITAALDIIRGFQMIFRCYKDTANYTGGGAIFSVLPANFFHDMGFFSAIGAVDITTVFLLALLWTFARRFVVSRISQPFANYCGVLPENVQKFGESAWKALACSLMWSSAIYVTFFRGYDFFQNPLQQYADWTLHRAPFDLSMVYAIEASFYIHSVYATLFMDAWRKDSVAMLMHHFVALLLITFSYSISCLKIGVLIFVLDDINDVVLELGKCATYLRKRTNGYSSYFFDVVSNFMAVLFAVLWVVLRLYWHLTKVWRSGSLGIWVSHPVLPLPFHLFQNSFLGSLYAFYLYWFWFIILFIGRTLSNNSANTIEDPRESYSQNGNKHYGKSNRADNNSYSDDDDSSLPLKPKLSKKNL